MKRTFELLLAMSATAVAGVAGAALPDFDHYQAAYSNSYQNVSRTWSTCTHDEMLATTNAPATLDNLSITVLRNVQLADEYCYTNILESGAQLSSIADDLNFYSRLDETNSSKAVLTLVLDRGDEDQLKFCTRAGEDWVFLAGKTAASLSERWDIKIEVDGSLRDDDGNLACKTRYSVKSRTAEETEYTVLTLTDGETEWIDSPYSTEAQPSGVQMTGAAVVYADGENTSEEQTATRPAYVELDDYVYELNYGYSNLVVKLQLKEDGDPHTTRYGESMRATFKFLQNGSVVASSRTPVIASDTNELTLDLSSNISAGDTYQLRIDFCGGDTVDMVTNIIDSLVLSGGGSSTVEGTRINLAGSHNLQLSSDELVAGTTYDISNRTGNIVYSYQWTDGGSKYAKLVNGQLVVKAGEAKNGCSSYLSYLLGLDADSATSVPGLQTVLGSDSSKVRLGVVGLVPNSDLAVYEYSLMSSSAEDGSYSKVSEAVFNANNNRFTFPLDMGSDRVRYYRVNVNPVLK